MRNCQLEWEVCCLPYMWVLRLISWVLAELQKLDKRTSSIQMSKWSWIVYVVWKSEIIYETHFRKYSSKIYEFRTRRRFESLPHQRCVARQSRACRTLLNSYLGLTDIPATTICHLSRVELNWKVWLMSPTSSVLLSNFVQQGRSTTYELGLKLFIDAIPNTCGTSCLHYYWCYI